jgi:hypothetical protein
MPMLMICRRDQPSRDQELSTVILLDCIAKIDQWMTSNRLKLNAEETELIWLGTSQQLAQVSSPPVTVGTKDLIPVPFVRELAVALDDLLTKDNHDRKIVRDCFYQLPQNRNIPGSVAFEARSAL